MLTLVSLLVLLSAYLIGSIPVGVLVGKAFGFDPRAVGSHNIGMTNVGRAGGRTAAALTLAGDVLKGLAPILIGQALHVSQGGLALIALATLVGAVYSVFLGFSGGRGVAAAFGIWLGLAPTSVAMVLLAVFVVMLALSRIVSLASVSAALALPIAVALCSHEQFFLMSLAMTALVLWRHRENIERLAAGREPAVGSGGKESTAA
jgi:glycerol-3-phosphate acyltransferase PlsY